WDTPDDPPRERRRNRHRILAERREDAPRQSSVRMLLRHRPPEPDRVRLLDMPRRVRLQRGAPGRGVVRGVSGGEAVVPDAPAETLARRPRPEHLEALRTAQRQHMLV